ncbi:hypothetical protein HYFRA_00003262 [Hymenoscyphus fraxineus]|uniref:Autophagy-related protein 14 n=1 Tax=Hymenoscyphus fraxineus TaxID=746836 RepID=A0A9N9KX27_9HELO|nr:hypothetical protein HYFRA_00003262 [Hymenoscyphus fraxineus]
MKPSKMQCDICFRTGGQKLPLLCATDARNKLYEARIQHAHALLEKDALDQEISSLLSAATLEEQQDKPVSPANRHTVASVQSEKDRVADRTQQIIAHADEFREKVEKARAEVAKRKARIALRKSELASASNGVDARRARQLEDVGKSIRITKYNWEKISSQFTTSRAYLCGEAAKLYGLRRNKNNADGQEEYEIGRVGIVDLRALNTASPAQISTALSHIVHLLMLTMHYLAIRLPAEINLPQPEQPQPTIYPVISSYMPRPPQSPNNNSTQSSNPSPTSSRHEQQNVNLPRPRPLHITKPLPMLLHEDPAAYALFIEGVSLLAYNVAWACRIQGVSVGEESSFDDICDIGRNLYNLLIGTKARSQPSSRASSAQSTPLNKSNGRSEPEDKKANSEPLMGKYSHGTASHFAGGAEATEFIRSWKLLNPKVIADKLRSLLQSEVANKEWELIDEGSWEIDNQMGDDGVVIGRVAGGSRDGDDLDTHSKLRGVEQSFMSYRTVDPPQAVDGTGDRKTGTSGWTKLKPR